MPTANKQRTQSKCRKWEKQRRGRLSAAFTALAAALPCPTPPVRKIHILQDSLMHVERMRAQLLELQETRAVPERSRDEMVEGLLSVSWELLRALLRAGVPLPPPPKIVKDVVTSDTDCNLAQDSKKSKNAESDKENVIKPGNVRVAPPPKSSQGEPAPAAASQKPAKKQRKSPSANGKAAKKKTLKKIAPVATTLSATNPTNAVWLTTGSGLRGPMVVGGGLLPLLSLPPPPPTIFLLQRPAPAPGGGVTHTTMVNKVPIPAFSSSLSMVKGKKSSKLLRLPKVTQYTRVKIFECAKKNKMLQDKQSRAQADKGKTKKVESKKSAEICPTRTENNQTSEGKSKMDSTNIVPTVSVSEKLSLEVTSQSSAASKIQMNVELKTAPVDGKHVFEGVPPVNNLKIKNESHEVTSAKETPREKSLNPPVSGDHQSIADPCPKQSEIKIIEPFALFSEIDKPRNTNVPNNLDPIKPNNHNENKKNDISELHKEKSEINKIAPSQTGGLISVSECRMGGKGIGNEAAEELLGGGWPAPLPPSPLPSSPTAAFLLAFPLVCSGPRPDTPLNDNLQTPNICSMDHFSNFFLPKEPASGLSLPSFNQNNNSFIDCQSKVTTETPSDRMKAVWFPPQGNEMYPKVPPARLQEPLKDIYRVTQSEPPSAIPSACVYSSDIPICFPHTKSIATSNNYCLSESMFNYEHAPVINSNKEIKPKMQTDNSKTLFHYDNLTSEPNSKSKVHPSDSSLYSTAVPPFCENVSSVPCNNGEKINTFSTPLFLPNDTSSCRNEIPSKLVFPGVVSEYSSVNKPIDIPFSFPTPSTSNIYSSCNTYNPFTTEIANTNLGVSCSSNSGTRYKLTSNSYFPDFSANIYTQSCNLWMEDEKICENPVQKTDFNKKMNVPVSTNQVQTQPVPGGHSQSEFRFFPPPAGTKAASAKPASSDIKNSKQLKFAHKDTKYTLPDNKGLKSECSSQKGPVNWMTSEVHSGQQTQDIFVPNYNRNAKSGSVPNPQYTVPINSTLTAPPLSLNMKKLDPYEQPFYHPPHADNVEAQGQYAWSPSKLASGDTLPGCLPTLVGDLALGISETKQPYQHLFMDLSDTSNKDRKYVPTKIKDTFVTPNTSTSNIDANSSVATGNFLSVSQIMERRKEGITSDQVATAKSTFPYTQKKNLGTENQNGNFILNGVGSNKAYEAGHPNTMPFYHTEVFPPQQVAQHYVPSQSKDVHQYNNKTQVNKNLNKNNYSTEALLQANDSLYHQSRRNKITSLSHKSYDASSLCIPASVHGNHHNSSSNTLQYENYAQNQTNSVSGYAYPPNPPLYAPPTNTYMTELTDSSVSTENVCFTPRVEHCKTKPQNELQQDVSKYSYGNKITTTKETPAKHKLDTWKKYPTCNKRQKKCKSFYTDNYGVAVPSQERNASNTMMDESFFGYISSSQMHPYPAQHRPSPSGGGASAGGNGPGTGTLTNFNLSTIFPEINKRSSMTFQDPAKAPTPFHL